jgi:predicted SAM-dependent methyltransferase
MDPRSVIERNPWLKRTPPYRLTRWIFHRAQDALRKSSWQTQRTIRDYLERHRVRKLHIGCGDNLLSGWLNTEYEGIAPRSVLYLDASEPFPLPSDTFDLVFSEHMIEHVSLGAAFSMLQESRRVLKPGGLIRISTPPLEYLIKLLVSPTPEDEEYLRFHCQEWNPQSPVFTAAVAVADYYKLWGHQFVYDEPTLRALMSKAGFVSIEKVAINESSHPELRNLEHDERLPKGMLKLLTLTLEAEKTL